MGKKKKGAVAPAVELPPHLRLGLNKDAYKRFCREELPMVGWTFGAGNYKYRGKQDPKPTPDTVKAWRSKYPEGLSWIAEQYGERLTGYDVAEATKMWLRENKAEDKSVCEVLKERGWEGVGEAELFLSHVQAESPEDTWRAMDRIHGRSGPARRGTKHEGSIVWVDYFCLRQLRNDFKPEQIAELIRGTGAVFVKIDGAATGCSYPRRSFCVLETSSAIEGGAILMIAPPTNGPLGVNPCSCWPCCICCCPLPDFTIDAAAATARRADDKAKVDKFIEEGPGFARVNQMMERELRRTAVKKSWGLFVYCCCLPCVVMGICFDFCCPRCNPCGCFLGL